MSRTTLANAKAELVALLVTGGAPAVSGVTQVYGYDPPVKDLAGPVAIAVSTDSVTPTEWRLAVRIYITATVDAKQAQDDLDTLIPAVDAKLTSGFGPSQWTIDLPSEERPFYTATHVLEVGREDYF